MNGSRQRCPLQHRQMVRKFKTNTLNLTKVMSLMCESDVWLTVHRNLVWIRNQLDVTYVLSFISPLQVAQHVSDNHVPIFRSLRLCSVIATCWYCAVAATCKGEIKDNT